MILKQSDSRVYFTVTSSDQVQYVVQLVQLTTNTAKGKSF